MSRRSHIIVSAVIVILTQRDNNENEFDFKMSQHPASSCTNITHLTFERGSKKVIRTPHRAPGAWEFCRGLWSGIEWDRCWWFWPRYWYYLLLAENCSRLRDRDAKCSLTLYFNSLLSLARHLNSGFQYIAGSATICKMSTVSRMSRPAGRNWR